MADMGGVRCGFYRRVPVGDQWRYEGMTLVTPDRNLVTPWPPAVGDVLSLAWIGDDSQPHVGMFRVLARAWGHAWWGSANFPYNAQAPTVGPMLDLVVEESGGLWENEAPAGEGDDG